MISSFLWVRDSGASVGPFWVSPGVKWDSSSGVLSRGFFTSRLGEILWVSPYFGWAFPWNLQYGVFRATGLTSGLWSRVFFIGLSLESDRFGQQVVRVITVLLITWSHRSEIPALKKRNTVLTPPLSRRRVSYIVRACGIGYVWILCVCDCIYGQPKGDCGFRVCGSPDFTMRWISTASLVGFKFLFSSEAVGFTCGCIDIKCAALTLSRIARCL